jgi:hypothetical protein
VARNHGNCAVKPSVEINDILIYMMGHSRPNGSYNMQGAFSEPLISRRSRNSDFYLGKK